jgi:hypothetical protein
MVWAAIAFGSVARGLDTEFSDLDLILVAGNGAGEELWQPVSRPTCADYPSRGWTTATVFTATSKSADHRSRRLDQPSLGA